MPLRIAFILLPNFTLTPFATLIDMLRLAADQGDQSRPIDCQWRIMGPTRAPVRASCGVEIRPDEMFDDPRQFDYIVVAGGLLKRAHNVDDAILDYLKKADGAGVSLIGICTGSFMLARAGLLTGRRCCVSWFHVADLLEECPEAVPDATRLFIADGRYITCAGGAGALDLAAWLVERHMGRARMQKSLHILLVDKARSADAAQPQPAGMPAAADERVHHAVLLMEQTLNQPPKVRQLARQVGLSPRQLQRLFLDSYGIGPQEVSRRLRLNYALMLLANTPWPITTIADDCGFSDAAHFSKAFSRAFGIAPTQIRQLSETTLRPLAIHVETAAAAPMLKPLSDLFAAGEQRPYPTD